MNGSESMLLATAILLMLILVCCVNSNEKSNLQLEGYLPFGRDEHDDPREDSHNLLREDTLWSSSAEDNIDDPYNLLNYGKKQVTNLPSDFISREVSQTNLLDDSTDYMGNIAYSKQLYKGKHFNYPTYKVGGDYLSPDYRLQPEDEEAVERRGPNYWNMDFVSPDGTVYDQVASRHDPSDAEGFTDGIHIGLNVADGDRNYMTMDIDEPFEKISKKLDPSFIQKPYDDILYENGSSPFETPELTDNEPARRVTNEPHSFYRYDLDYYSDDKEGTLNPLSKLQKISASVSPEDDTERNFYNVMHFDYNLNINNGAYGNEINVADMDNVDEYMFKQTGPTDVTRPTLNWDSTYNGGENFTGQPESFLSNDAYVREERHISQFDNPRAKWKDIVDYSDHTRSKLEQFVPNRQHVRSDINAGTYIGVDMHLDNYANSLGNISISESDLEAQINNTLPQRSITGDIKFNNSNNQLITYPKINADTNADIIYDPVQIEFPTGEQSVEDVLGKYRSYN